MKKRRLTKARSRSPAQKPWKKSFHEAVTAYGTLAAAIAAAAAAGATLYQARLTDQIARRQLRAYVQITVDEEKFKDVSETALSTEEILTLNIINVGQTPAYKVHLTVMASTNKENPEESNGDAQKQVVGPILIMNGQKKAAFFGVYLDGAGADRKKILRYLRDFPEEHVYFRGYLDYFDIYSSPHHADVCFDMFIVKGEPRESLAECNSADDS